MNELPHVTVATVVCEADRFLLVKESSAGKTVYNQPAGHVETGESVQQAAIRETLEETGWQVELTHYLGTYQHDAAENGISYVRHCFIAAAVRQQSEQPLDTDIEAAVWLTREQVEGLQAELRSPMVWRAIEDYCQGQYFSLSIFKS
ncbi:MAG: NUDIX hydrolase [Gammaproteobacteria bacterium]